MIRAWPQVTRPAITRTGKSVGVVAGGPRRSCPRGPGGWHVAPEPHRDRTRVRGAAAHEADERARWRTARREGSEGWHRPVAYRRSPGDPPSSTPRTGLGLDRVRLRDREPLPEARCADPRRRPSSSSSSGSSSGRRTSASAARIGRCCHGQLIPALDDPKAWIEWIHRTVAVVIGFEILGLAVLAFIDHRDRRSILWPTLAAVVLVGFQAWLGRETVRLGNSGESVTAHLASAMALVGAAGLPHGPGGLPGADAGSRREPAVHAPGGVRGGSSRSRCCCSGRTSRRPARRWSSRTGR